VHTIFNHTQQTAEHCNGSITLTHQVRQPKGGEKREEGGMPLSPIYTSGLSCKEVIPESNLSSQCNIRFSLKSKAEYIEVTTLGRQADLARAQL